MCPHAKKLFFPKQNGPNDFLIPAFVFKRQRPMLDWLLCHHGEQALFGLWEARCLRVVRRANEFCPAGARRISHLPGEPVEARVNPVQAFVVTVRRLVLVINTFIVFHAATMDWQRRARHGVFT
jgi:hypothetical protein